MTNDQQLSMGLPSTQPLTTVEQYQFKPIKGYPMLHWKGKRPFTTTQYYPAQLKEVHGAEKNGWHNKIYWADNLQAMSHLLKEFRGKVNLIYIDPPFDSKAEYKKKIQLRRSTVYNDQNTFEEKQYTNIWTNDEYLQFMFERICLIRELLSDNGTVYLHCDARKNHHLRCLLDEVFSSNNFRSEIQWQRVSGRAGTNHISSIQDSILVYTKGPSWRYYPQYAPLDESYVRSHYNQVDENGRRFRWDNATAEGDGPDRIFFGKLIAPPPGTHWRWTQRKIDQLIEERRIGLTSNGKPQYKRYLDENPGKVIQSIWTDISPVNSQAIEDTGYPTQKPKALLERIIKTSSKPNDIVLDCFMGSGTTQEIAMRLGRRFIGTDINLGALQTTTKRLLSVAAELEERQQQGSLEVEEEPITYYTGFEVYNVNHYDVFRNPLQAKDLLLEALEVNPLVKGSLFDGEKEGRMVKIMPINRITTRADLNELIAGFDYKAFERRQAEDPRKPVEKVTLVCMGHEPDLAAQLKKEVQPFSLDVEVVDILRDKSNLEFKRDSEAKITIQGQYLMIEKFYPMNLLQKLSLQHENVEDWRELVESVMIDWNFDGAILEPKLVDIPNRNELVQGRYLIPKDAGTIRVKITDLLSESLEMEIAHG